MSTTYPTTKQTLPNPTSTDLLENADNTLDHDYQHGTVNDTIEALQDKVGVDGSAVTTTHDYKLSAVTGSAKALTSGTSTQSVTGLTLVNPVLTIGSDATGDIYYRNSGGALTRLPIGTSGQILEVSGSSIPQWIANPSAADASTTVKGVVEIATTAQITAGTGAGETGALLVVPASAVGSAGASKLVQYTAGGLYPAADGSLITNIILFTNGIAAKNAADGSGTQNIAHGLGKIPKKVKITGLQLRGGASDTNAFPLMAFTVYNGTTQSSTSIYATGSTQSTSASTFTLNVNNSGSTYSGVVTFDATNIIITWTSSGSPGGTYQLLWEAEG